MPRKKSAAKKAREALVQKKVINSNVPTDKKSIDQLQENVTSKSHLLEESSSEDEEINSFQINEEYAKRFEHNKKREELQKLEAKYGEQMANGVDGEGSDESSSEEEEDSDGELVTPEVDAAILRMIVKIRNKDPDLYDSQQKYFDEVEKDVQGSLKSKDGFRSVTLKDYHRQKLLSGEILDAEEDEPMPNDANPTHVEEQERLRKETIAAFHDVNGNKDAVSNESDEDGDFLVKKEKTKKQLEEEEHGYERFLLESAQSKEARKVLEDLSSSYVKQRPSVLVNTEDDENGIKPSDEDFLLKYMMNRGWRTSNTKQPSYEEIIDEVDAENRFDEDAEEFENKFNFRFEEEAGSQIVSHPRNVADSLRRKDDSRKRARDRKKERLEEASQKRLEEVNRLKNLKRKELEEKLNQVIEIAGSKNIDVSKLDLDEDFDPEKWESKMSEIFNENYYEEDSAKKPEFGDDIDIDDIAQVDNGSEDLGSIENKTVEDTGNREKSKKSLRKDIREKKRKIDEYVEEKYGVPEAVIVKNSKFRYQQVAPETFGLDILDILNASDADLNNYVGLKKMTPYRTPEEIARDKKKYGKKKRLREWKKQVFGK
ncbi:ribosome biogenesis protein Kri1 [Schizosaccharomyces pombe]|uniref:Protein kri1 n=1 Tax=Schizosaccharomyces pombe (strain 972 / ATCC 24843) TaxID=284812 RepID=KRI1_SCHPO|nr:putative krr family protein [Schizosaccharomyces pombe]Q09799.1 RecName: Full=Protein kri1 [Schizosaccharomyces pombe 972h-]CAA91129.1 krr family protein (predicted) [Schizosaccharomyces pombe]|eukprot:NP_593054.1 putative krr family protein [Schizosaccharomyces pombe]